MTTAFIFVQRNLNSNTEQFASLYHATALYNLYYKKRNVVGLNLCHWWKLPVSVRANRCGRLG